jgi:hypothetical protein
MNRNAWILLAAFLLLGGGGYAAYTMTRGLRNNNPLNIEDDGTDWEGLDSPRNDGGPGVPKLRFISPQFGYRAAARTLHNHITHDGVPSTLNGVLRRWSATDQAAYVAKVSRDLGVDPDAALDLTSSGDLPALFASMTEMENGINPYSATLISSGIAMA